MSPTQNLLKWFRSNARDLPWRTESRDPYRTLVSEVMLQQTQVDRVVPRFEAFIAEFPDFPRLASATEDQVVAKWSGLGYYRRARFLHRLARGACFDGNGRLPEDAEGLRSLPGVGEYTAAAIASLAFGKREAVLDGNTRRVAARVLASELDPRTVVGRDPLRRWIESLFEDERPGEVNEALMELGATICSPVAPDCSGCPLQPWCRARSLDRPEAFPAPRRMRKAERIRWVASCVVSRDGLWLVRRVVKGPILWGLWLPAFTELLEGDCPIHVATKLAPFSGFDLPVVGSTIRHSITYRRIEVVPVLLPVSHTPVVAATWQWVMAGQSNFATSSLLEKLQKAFNTGK